jgi:hypothetical protein
MNTTVALNAERSTKAIGAFVVRTWLGKGALSIPGQDESGGTKSFHALTLRGFPGNGLVVDPAWHHTSRSQNGSVRTIKLVLSLPSLLPTRTLITTPTSIRASELWFIDQQQQALRQGQAQQA